MTFHLIFDSHMNQIAILVNFFFNALKIKCFMIIEGKYPQTVFTTIS